MKIGAKHTNDGLKCVFLQIRLLTSCLRLSRLGGTSRLIAVGAGAAVALFFVTQIASSFGSSGAIPALIAAWSPALCALFISLTVLAYQEDG